VVCVFARKTSEPLASLVKQIDKKIGENRQLKSFVVLLSDKGDNDLKKLAKDSSIKNVPLTMHRDPAGLPDYDITRDAADVTVLMWNHHKVKVNRAFKGDLTEKDIRLIVDDVPKVLE
jgi:hypothetical protein